MNNKLVKLTRKSLLYKSGVEYADYGLNHVEGCSHGCTYPCYAMMLKKRCGVIKTYQDWIKPKIVENALDLLEKELPKLKHKIKQVFLCFSTDPFMYQINEVNHLTLSILKRLNDENIKSVLITKGIYPNSLISDLFNERNEYGATIVSLSEVFRQKYEPFAAPVKDRIKALRKLHNAGLKTWVSMEPYPTPNIVDQSIERILNEIAFVDKVVFGKWNYSNQSTGFVANKQFYNRMAFEVIRFCDEHKIDVHIKDRTITVDSIESQRRQEKKLLLAHS